MLPKPLKDELYLWRRAFRRHILLTYLWHRFIVAPRVRSWKVPISPPITHPELTVHVLLCHRDMTMALWSLASFYRESTVVGQLMIHSDGTLTEDDQALLRRLIPDVVIISKEGADEAVRTSDGIPDDVRKFRLTTPYVYLKKLVDTYVLAPGGYHLLIDSDLAWFDTPVEIEQVVREGTQHSLMTLNGKQCPVWTKGGGELDQRYTRYNGGIIFFHHDDLDLSRLATFFDLLDIDRKQLWVGQAGHAYCLEHLSELSWERYPNRGPIEGVVMKHYTQPQRERFYTEALPRLRTMLARQRGHGR